VEIVLATDNAGKLGEISALLAGSGITFLAQGALDVPTVEETGHTFIENAILKARNAATYAARPALADDSGLVVTALGGDPGIYSARWAGPDKDFGLAMQKVEDGLQGKEDRTAHFACALSLCWPDDGQRVHLETFEGNVHGVLVWPPRGDKGFGYDPVFMADGDTITFGEMDQDKKHQISHRADAFRKLVDACFRN